MSETTEDREPPGALSSVRSAANYGRGFWIKILFLSLLTAVGIFAFATLLTVGAWIPAGAVVIGLAFINWVYLSRGTKALRWITPGLVMMLIFVMWPIVFTFYLSLTNWATGNILTQEQVVEQLEKIPLLSSEDEAPTVDLLVYRNDAGVLKFLVTTPDGEQFFGEPRLRSEEPVQRLEDLGAVAVVDSDGDGTPESIDGFNLLLLRDLIGISDALNRLVLDVPSGVVTPQTVSQAKLVAAAQRYTYDPATDSVYDAQLDRTCVAERGNFVCDGRRLDPGWRVVVGPDNYSDVLANERIREPFLQVFLWNIVFAALSVILGLAAGLLMAMALQDDRLRMKPLYRSLLIIPYAIPAFISALVWRGFFNDRFGQVNRILEAFGAEGLNWLGDPFWAKVALIIANIWLGFPYFFLISTGALQSIPEDLKQAARVDGASSFRVFRSITFPLLMVSLAPLLIGSFAFNFNNFILIFLLTRGGPPVLDAAVPVGHTDILITFTFDTAVSAGRGNNFGLGAALSILIFIMVAAISAISFRTTRQLEETYQ